MGPILAVRSADIDHVIDNQNRAVRRIMRENAQFIHHVIAPDDIGIFRSRFDRWRGALSRFAAIKQNVLPNIFGFVFERPVIAIGHAVDIEANDLATAGDQVNPVAVNGR